MQQTTTSLIAGLIFACSLPTTTCASPQPPSTSQEAVARFTKILGQGVSTDSDAAARDDIARQQAEAATKLLKLGQPGLVWPLLRQTADNSRRTYLIHDFGKQGVNPTILIKRLETEPDVSARRALILGLGEFTAEQMPLEKRRPLVKKLLGWYCSDPDPGIHSAIDWLLRHGSQGNTPRKLDWHQGSALAAIDRELAGKTRGRLGWYITSEGHTMTVLRGPMVYFMGSPTSEPGRVSASDSPQEPLRRVNIPRSFAIASKDVTVAEFQRFLAANPDVKRGFAYTGDPGRMDTVLQTFSPDEDGPQIALTWYEAVMYCNWLSQKEGIPKSEWVYPTSFDLIKDGMELQASYLHKTGYRLPTEAEWEYAVRAGSATSRFYGTSTEMLEQYAWYSKHPPVHKNDPADPADPHRTWPVGELKPNDFGLFDAYGNVWDWCQDRLQELPPDDQVSEDKEDNVRLVTDKASRTRRGGSFPYEANMMRSAGRDTRYAFPMFRRDNVGLRIARTIR